jgi:hypothetical protein
MTLRSAAFIFSSGALLGGMLALASGPTHLSSSRVAERFEVYLRPCPPAWDCDPHIYLPYTDVPLPHTPPLLIPAVPPAPPMPPAPRPQLRLWRP